MKSHKIRETSHLPGPSLGRGITPLLKRTGIQKIFTSHAASSERSANLSQNKLGSVFNLVKKRKKCPVIAVFSFL